MSTAKKWLGLKRKVYCDRCNKEITSEWGYNLCDSCFKLSTSKIRSYELKEVQINKSKGLVECSFCGHEFDNSTRKDICWSCRSTHIDNTHYAFNTEPPPVGHTRAHHCFKCGGVQLASTLSERQYSFQYFMKGNRTPSLTPYKCTNDFEDTTARMKICTHDWIAICSNVVSSSEAKRRANEMSYSANLLSLDKDMIEVMSSGTKTFWCWKCGNFYNLIPRYEKRLPVKGKDLLDE